MTNRFTEAAWFASHIKHLQKVLLCPGSCTCCKQLSLYTSSFSCLLWQRLEIRQATSDSILLLQNRVLFYLAQCPWEGSRV